MNYKVDVLLFMSMLYLFLVYFVYNRGRNRNIAKSFSLFAGALALWSFGLAMFFYFDERTASIFWAKFLYLSGSLVASAFLLFSVIYSESARYKLFSLKSFYIFLPSFLAIIIFLPTSLLIKDIFIKNDVKGLIYGPLRLLWELQLNGSLILGFYQFWQALKKSQGILRVHLKCITIANLTIYVFSGITDVFLPWFNIFNYIWLGPVLTLIWFSIVTYTIIRYRLMEVTVAITRTGVFIAVYSFVLGIPFILAFGLRRFLINSFGESWWIIPFITLGVLATVGPFIYIYLQRKAEDQIFKEQRRYQSVLRQASTSIGRIKDLKHLLELLVHISTQAVGLKHAAVYVYNNFKDGFILGAARNHPPMNEIIPANSAMVGYLRENKISLIYEEFKLRMGNTQGEISQMLEALDAALVIPNFTEDRLVGILVLGQKRSGKIFSDDDLSAFSILGNQAALAMENLNSLQEMKKAQEKLFHAEKLAYVGQLASSIVHEVRNPLVAIKTFVSYVPDKFEKQDVDFFKRFAAIVPSEIQRVEKIVHDLLDLAKPKQAQRNEVKISVIIATTAELFKDSFELKGIHIEQECLTDNDKIFCDQEQMQQVMLNLFLNAFEAMEEGGQLKVKVFREADRLMIMVKDTGCGIPEEELKKMFTPFYTTKKDGVGLGLIITQEIIKSHGGEIKVKSELGRGTEFIIALPTK